MKLLILECCICRRDMGAILLSKTQELILAADEPKLFCTSCRDQEGGDT